MKACFLILVAFVAISPVFGQSESDFKVSVNLSGDGVVIDKYLGKEKIVVIPATIQGFPVREIGNVAFQNSSVVSVTIPEGVTKIGERAFTNSSDLASITLPSTIKIMGVLAFYSCKSLPLATQAQLRKLGYAGRF